jgi:hypothetical protein
MAERLLLRAMAAVDGSLTGWRAECEDFANAAPLQLRAGDDTQVVT